ncbi:MAG: ATP-binding cassette domain-containing protein, partial [archaeon]|nr:ATP-binding cassette domain-containing protein [archaeon]
MNYVIETKNLTKKYKNQIVVDSINLNVEKGKIYGLLGKNGAGKTTTMSLILNLAKPTDGEIKLFGVNSKDNPQLYSKIGSIIEAHGFYYNLTGFENLRILAELRGNYNKDNIIKSLKIVSLDSEDEKLVKHYSLGMKQRLAIATAIMDFPELLILDEPINGLDPVGIKDMRKLFKCLVNEYNMTIFISSHILSEIEHIADVIGIMDEGKLIEEIYINNLHEKLSNYVDFEVSDY